MIILTLLPFLQCISCLTYDEVMKAKSGSKFSIEQLNSLSSYDLINSLQYLGAEQLNQEQAQTIWEKLVEIYEDVSTIPEEILFSLGWVSRGIPLSDIANMTFIDIDTIASFGQYHSLKLSQLKALGDQVLINWTKDPEEFSFIDLIALNQLLCGFNGSIIRRIHPQSYKEAAMNLRNIQDCSPEVLQSLALLAVHPEAFGPSQFWNSNELSKIGCILGGLDSASIANIPEQTMEHLSNEFLNCWPSEIFQAFTNNQLSKVQPSIATKLLEENKIILTEKKKEILLKAAKWKFYNNSNAALYDNFPYYITLLVFIF